MSEILIREAVQADIPGINQLFSGEYGHGYPYQLGIINPEQINLVACEAQRIIGFARAVVYGHYVHVWELCGLIVHPNYRGYGIAKAFTVERIRRLRQMGVKTLVSEAVTCYEDCASQRNLLQFGFQPFGILPFIHPWIRPEVLGTQPLSLVLMIVSLNGGTGFGNRELFLHDKDRHALELFIDHSHLNPPWNRIVFSHPVELQETSGKTVHGIKGSDFVDVPLNTIESLQICAHLRQEGFRLAGILPGFGRTLSGNPIDLLRLYRSPVSDKPLTFDLVHVIPQLLSLKRFCAKELELF
ncbi:MAG: hypothetical protein UT30_C0011G0001 [Candidatus Uhrbacteria bacterium GW2011_GWF2_39_13]|uniref:N-acetyltransferase domain-containing protein n=1 Tax=Candidatus Uhrbacteria bacterium GW2011_GWF2_39_13 TaxID=1618995 RepID=A0A0G0Q167_9BACT|nr:MAG: hypothetical protein UT30_C0011G0001 [Candidatus Uhrbacteria bacterium GW2011_GWF2_39_13]HAU66672.1 hypothetical protein [Candidatus Uhrbacteria bacterium]